MKEKIKKLLSTIMTAFILITSLNIGITPVFAEETTPNSGEMIDTIRELGTIEEVFPELANSQSNKMSRAITSVGERYGKVFLDNQFGFDYITHLYVDGKTVFCIEPMELFTAGQEYYEDTAKWDELSEQQRQAIWEINYYGYSYPGHQTGNYYYATQLLIWEVVDQWYQPYSPDGSTPVDLSAEINEINRLRSQPQGRPSFHNTTVKMGLNTPVTLTDSKGVLGDYSIHSGNGISASASGNDLTVAITSESYDNTLTFNKNFDARDVNIIYGKGGAQRVIYLATRKDPTTNFKLNFELLYADIEVEKQDIETGNVTQGDATFNGATFELRDLNGNVKETLVTNGSKVTSKKYPIGTSYNVCEITPPTGYLPNETCNRVDLTFSGDNTPEHFYTIYKDKVIKGKIEIAKSIEQEREKPYESVIQKPGVGFKFDIFLKSSGEKVTTLTTNEEGRAISELLPYGTYIVKEQAVEGYDTLEPFEVFIDENEKIYFYNIYNDTLKAELNIYKTDTETGKRIPAAGVEFKIKDEYGNFIKQTVTYPSKYETDTFITDENGAVHLPEALIYGKYKIVEIKAPYGYVLKDTEIPFEVDGATKEIFMNFDNKAQKGQVTIEKFGERFVAADFRLTEHGKMYSPIYESQKLAGITYEIYAKEDIVGEEGTLWYHKGDLVDTFTTDEEGMTKSKELPLGSYILKESKTLVGFVLDPTEYEVNIEYEGQLVEIVQKHYLMNNDRQKLNVELHKTFEEDDKTVYKDVLFGIYTKEDITIGEEIIIPKDNLVGVFTIDESGKNKEQYDLPIGDYYIKELETNVGYVLDENKYDFSFKYDEDTTKATVLVKLDEIKNNKRRLDIEIKKIDADHQDILLNGAIFEVYDKTTKKDMGIVVSGKLGFKGNAVNEEYEIANDEAFETIITTSKTNSKKEIVLDLKEGTYYSRKVGSKEVTKHIVKDGHAVLADAIYGHEYEFKEIASPNSYQLSNNRINCVVKADKEVSTLSFVFKNKRIEVPNTGV